MVRRYRQGNYEDKKDARQRCVKESRPAGGSPGREPEGAETEGRDGKADGMGLRGKAVTVNPQGAEGTWQGRGL